MTPISFSLSLPPPNSRPFTPSPSPPPFTYPRSDPSLRWPHLPLPHIPSPPPPPTPPPPPPPPPLPLDPLPSLPPLDAVAHRSRAKKLSKLALKRAKDWRLRVHHLSHLILSLPPHSPVADVLDAKPLQMTPTDYSLVVRRVGSADWRRALELYEWLNLRRWHSPDPRMLSSIISILGRNSQDSLAEELFARGTAPGSDGSVQVYNAIMGVHARRGRFARVREVLELMRSRGCEPDLVSFNTMINARVKAGQLAPGDAMGIIAEVRRSGLRPDTVTYNTLISACSHGCGPEEAAQVFEDMEASGCEPDLWTYNAMVSVYGRCGKATEAEKLFRELAGKGLVPDAVTYNSLVYAFAKEGELKEAERVCGEMGAAGFKKDEITYNTIIHMYGKHGMVNLALRFYGEMKDAGCRPDAVTYTVLIDCLGKAGRASDAERVMEEMVDLGARPTLKTYSALICAYAKSGMREEAEEAFDRMVRSGVKPDNLAYGVTIDVVLRSGDTRRAMVLYKDMVRDGCRPDEGLYQVMLTALMKDGKNEDVKVLVRDMKDLCGMRLESVTSLLVKAECFDCGVDVLKEAILQGEEVDNEMLSSIVNAYAASNKQEEASSLLDFLKEHAPNCQELVTTASIVMLCKKKQVEAAIEEYNQLKGFSSTATHTSCSLLESLITCCEETGFFPEACQLFSDMRFHGIEPSHNIYRCMINIYCKMSFPEMANVLLDEAVLTGLSCNDLSHYVTLIEAYGKVKLLQRAEDLVTELRRQGMADRKVWNALIYAYAESGCYEQARAVFDTMMKDGLSPTVESINGLIQALIVDKRLDEIYVVIQELQDMDFKISKSTIVLMLDAFVRAGNIFEVKKIYNGMKETGYLPNMHLYRSMITLFCRGKRVRDVETMLVEMEQASFMPDLPIYNSLIRMYIGIEDFRKVANMYQKIQEAGFLKDEETYNLLILMYSKDRRPEEGLSLLHEMEKHGLEPKLETYKSLLTACGRDQLFEQAEDLYERIQSKPHKLDRSVYHVMLKIYRESGNHNKAEEVLSEMKKVGVQPTMATMHLLMDTYGSGGQPQEAEKLLHDLKNSGLDLSTLPYSSVIDAYLKSGNYDMAIKTLMDMRRDGVQPDHRIWTCFIRGATMCSQTSEAILLLNSLLEAEFDIPMRLLTEKSELLVREIDLLFDKIGSEDNASLNFVNALEDLLWAFERRATASWIFQLAIRKGIYRSDIFRVADKDWGADFRKLSAGAAFVGLTLWLDLMQDASLQGFPESPKSVVLITGTAEYHMVSLNKSLKLFLWEMGSPFMPCRTRTGLLVSKAHSLRMWLKDSSFCMDLELRDSPLLPKLNSMQLTEGYFMRTGLVPAFKEIHERMGQVSPKKFARLALMSDERRDKVITADIEGRKEKLEKMKKKGDSPRSRRPTRLRTGKFMRRKHNHQVAQGSLRSFWTVMMFGLYYSVGSLPFSWKICCPPHLEFTSCMRLTTASCCGSAQSTYILSCEQGTRSNYSLLLQHFQEVKYEALLHVLPILHKLLTVLTSQSLMSPNHSGASDLSFGSEGSLMAAVTQI